MRVESLHGCYRVALDASRRVPGRQIARPAPASSARRQAEKEGELVRCRREKPREKLPCFVAVERDRIIELTRLAVEAVIQVCSEQTLLA